VFCQQFTNRLVSFPAKLIKLEIVFYRADQYHNQQILDEITLVALIKNNPLLECLRIEEVHVSIPSDSVLIVISETLKCLKTFDFINDANFTLDGGITQVLINCPELIHFHVNKDVMLSETFTYTISRENKTKELNSNFFTNTSSVDWYRFFSHFSGFTNIGLSIPIPNYTDTLMDIIAENNWETLSTTGLWSGDVSGPTLLRFCDRCINAHYFYLDMAVCERVNLIDIHKIFHFPNKILTSVTILDCRNLTLDTIALILKNCLKLEELNVSGPLTKFAKLSPQIVKKFVGDFNKANHRQVKLIGNVSR
jgi:hypothetical protein